MWVFVFVTKGTLTLILLFLSKSKREKCGKRLRTEERMEIDRKGMITLGKRTPPPLVQGERWKAKHQQWYEYYCQGIKLRYFSPNEILASLVVQRLKHLPAMWETWVRSLGQEDPLEKEMATHSSTLAWRIPWMEELGGLQSMGRKESDTTERLHFLSPSGLSEVRTRVIY